MTIRSNLDGKSLALPSAERDRLADSLTLRLEAMALTDIDRAWLEVAEVRFSAYKAGMRAGIPGDSVFCDIRKELGWSKN